MATRSSYTVVYADQFKVLIEDDLGTGAVTLAMSVTNDAEAVVEELLMSGILIPGRRLYYLDSQRELDEITFDDHGFIGFKPCGDMAVEDIVPDWVPG